MTITNKFKISFNNFQYHTNLVFCTIEVAEYIYKIMFAINKYTNWLDKNNLSLT